MIANSFILFVGMFFIFFIEESANILYTEKNGAYVTYHRRSEPNA